LVRRGLGAPGAAEWLGEERATRSLRALPYRRSRRPAGAASGRRASAGAVTAGPHAPCGTPRCAPRPRPWALRPSAGSTSHHSARRNSPTPCQ